MELIFFFFQAEDGIRDWSVTGVQTCALPIYGGGRKFGVSFRRGDVRRIFFHPRHLDGFGPGTSQCECSLVREAVEHAAPAEIGRASCRERDESRAGADACKVHARSGSSTS